MCDPSGPGTYAEVQLHGKGPAFTMRTRPKSPLGAAEGGDSPGPTHYALNTSALGGPAYTMQGKTHGAKVRRGTRDLNIHDTAKIGVVKMTSTGYDHGNTVTAEIFDSIETSNSV